MNVKSAIKTLTIAQTLIAIICATGLARLTILQLSHGADIFKNALIIAFDIVAIYFLITPTFQELIYLNNLNKKNNGKNNNKRKDNSDATRT
jgi:hypothetical protein